MKAFCLGVLVLIAVLAQVMVSSAQAESKKDQCPAQLEQARATVQTGAVNENLLENEVNQKRKQIASLGLQLQQERQAHAETKKAMAKLQSATDATKAATPKE